jgi:mediator of RNA polymerase II transcription subunit 14
LRFSRCAQLGAASSSTFNPHDDAEPFLRNILRHGHGRLSPSVHSLVALLRDTLPIVAELEDIRLDAEKAGETVDTFAKAAGWYRLLYGDLRHALDFRLLHGQRVAILDGSHSLFRGDLSASSTAAAASSPSKLSPAKTPSSKPSPAKSVTGLTKPSSVTVNASDLGLQAIPQFQDIVLEAIQDATIAHPEITDLQIASVDVGVVCDTGAVRFVTRALHEKILRVLKV